MFPTARVSEAITANFVPVNAHIKEQPPQVFERFGIQWEPTQLWVDPSGAERHRTVGYLPVEDFLPQLELGLAKVHFGREQFDEAAKRFRSVYEKDSATAAAPEACYWAGVSAYKATGRREPLSEAAQLLKTKYAASDWAKKASVWLP